MSAEALPISSERFSKALEGLSISSLYLKVAELRNSLGHLVASNLALEDYVQETQDKECYEAILENREVMKRFDERIALIKREVTVVRSLMWQPEEGEERRVEVGEREEGRFEERGAAQRVNGSMGDAAMNGTREEAGANGAEETADVEEGVFL